jgi:hypothetical protein
MGLFGWTSDWGAGVVTSLAVWAMLWAICYALYKKKILIRI